MNAQVPLGNQPLVNLFEIAEIELFILKRMREFTLGDHANVFEAGSPGGVLTWHLDRNVATATADFGVRCVASAP